MSGPVSCSESFHLFVPSGASTIAVESLGEALFSAGKRITLDEVTILVQKATSSYGNNLTYAQFQSIYNLAGTMESRDAELKKSLLVFDAGNGRGLLNKEQLRHALINLGDKMTEAEVDTILKDAGVSKENASLVDYKALLRLVQQTPIE